MRLTTSVLTFAVFCLSASTSLAAETSRAEQILDRLHHANQWRNHVMVVAHRTGFQEKGKALVPEDSVAAIRRSIGLGAEMVELDVRKSADGKLVVMHDSYLDRTTTCKGQVARTTFAQMQHCHLVINGTRRATHETVPTLKDMFRATRDRILVNIDDKLGPEILPEIAAEARELGMADQIVMKENLWNDARVAEAKAVMARVGSDVPFMPIFADDAVHGAAFTRKATKAFGAPAAELIEWQKTRGPLTTDGGDLFTAKVRAAAIAGNWHIWADTYAIVNKPDGMLAGGRGDGLATKGGKPGRVYGFWVDRGATIIQTDEPKAAIGWLDSHGYRIPYKPTVLATALAN